MAQSIGILRGGWGLTALYLAAFMFFLGVFGTANMLMGGLPIALILWVLPAVAAGMAGVAFVGVGDAALAPRPRLHLAIRLSVILLLVGAALTWVAASLGNPGLTVFGFPGNAFIWRGLVPGVLLFALNLAGLWLGGKIALSGQSA
ncbi:hypothetical protein [Paracoccus shanxieyensis]|uniref:Uncharacterized protein n=1 Tax=Paracoccus shanxieyensis TaxID=2675752 RepID=A0A6L6IVY9_9RHOB|nr:hypothetical protein [Paracoccus shanxieyensis]MTH64655.1 hypothetical protein [Paracoccus shanxieyensis]MTH87799.1 hypothetical protein [Paracoccus shanxieyensis]